MRRNQFTNFRYHLKLLFDFLEKPKRKFIGRHAHLGILPNLGKIFKSQHPKFRKLRQTQKQTQNGN